jgi:hypothetical protein
MAVLGVLKGFSNLPEDMKNGVKAIGDSIFINTTYSFNLAVENTYKYAVQLIKQNGGEISDKEAKIKIQQPVPLQPEVSFPNVVFDKKVSVFDEGAWKLKGNWQNYQKLLMGPKKEMIKVAKYAEKSGDELELTFDGTGISMMGNWFKDGGKADVFLDGKLHRTIDTYFAYNGQEHEAVSMWHVFQLQPGQHTIKIVVKGEKRAESIGTKIYITEALIYKTAPKKNETYKFSFE